MYWKPLLISALTMLPGVPGTLFRRSPGASESAEYCYGVWLKHLVMLRRSGVRALPRSLVELGPGRSLGVGIAALLSGVEHYYGLDVVRDADMGSTLSTFDRLVALFQARAPRPCKGWPDYDDGLDVNLFPSHILTDELLDHALDPERLQRIRAALKGPHKKNGNSITFDYVAPWSVTDIRAGTVDLVLSHAVMQSVADLQTTYRAMHSWLKPGGAMSHQIDYTSFRTAREWNGHRAYSEGVWKVLVAARPAPINREPHSTHVELTKKNGFEILCELRNYAAGPGIDRSRLAQRWKTISEDDLTCCGGFIQARKPEH